MWLNLISRDINGPFGYNLFLLKLKIENTVANFFFNVWIVPWDSWTVREQWILSPAQWTHVMLLFTYWGKKEKKKLENANFKHKRVSKPCQTMLIKGSNLNILKSKTLSFIGKKWKLQLRLKYNLHGCYLNEMLNPHCAYSTIFV